MPNLIANYKEKVFVTSAKKSYSVVMNAMNSWLAKNGTPGDFESFWSYSSDINVLAQEFAKELNSAKVCTNSDVDACGGRYDIRQYKKTNDGSGNTVSEWWIGRPSHRIVLTDGTFIVLSSDIVNGSCTKQQWVPEKDSNGFYIDEDNVGHYSESYNCGRVGFDTNGLKGPNQIGIDVFEVPFGSSTNSKVSDNGDAWGNIKYVLANDKLIKTENYQTGKYE